MVKSVCEEKSFDYLYREHISVIRNFIYYKCGDLAKAEDISQESFVRLWNKCKEVIFEKAKSYLYTVSQRLLIDQYRKDQVNLNFEKQQVSAVNHQDPHFELRTKEFRANIEKAISDLPEGQREAFLLNRIDKYTYKEIAVLLDISETAVEKRIGKALLKLKGKIEELKNI